MKLNIVLVAVALLTGCSALSFQAPKPLAANGCAMLIDEARSSFAMLEVDSRRILVCNAERAGKRFTAASTFKIAHALIALETGVVKDENAPLPWDGQARGVPAWDQPTSMAGAIPASTVWVFQQFAEQIGWEREQAWLSRLSYGNAQAGDPGQLRHFWLTGPLAISALEQLSFLNALRTNRLPASAAHQSRVRAMLRIRNCGPDCTLFGKTGAVLPIDDKGFLRSDPRALVIVGERTGWFVGWVERPARDGGPVVFAHNVDLELPGAMAARTRVAEALLAANGVIPKAN